MRLQLRHLHYLQRIDTEFSLCGRRLLFYFHFHCYALPWKKPSRSSAFYLSSWPNTSGRVIRKNLQQSSIGFHFSKPHWTISLTLDLANECRRKQVSQHFHRSRWTTREQVRWHLDQKNLVRVWRPQRLQWSVSSSATGSSFNRRYLNWHKSTQPKWPNIDESDLIKGKLIQNSLASDLGPNVAVQWELHSWRPV